MSNEFIDTRSQIREVINRLQTPVADLTTLLALLVGPLGCLGLLPPQFRQYNTTPLPDRAVDVTKHIPSLQRVLLENVAPTWELMLSSENAGLLLDQYFCPDSFSFASPAAGDVALQAYSTLLSSPLRRYSFHVLVRLSKEYPIDRLYAAVFDPQRRDSPLTRSSSWDDCVRNVMAVPAKVANAIAGQGDIPLLLERSTYYRNVCIRTESLIFSSSNSASRGESYHASKVGEDIHSSPDCLSALSYLLIKLVNNGLFPPTPPSSPAEPSFFQETLPIIRRRLRVDEDGSYSSFWTELLSFLPSASSLQAILTSLFSSLREISPSLGFESLLRGRVKQEAKLLSGILGPLKPSDELWECATGIMLGREWNEGQARVFACWAAGESNDVEALGALLSQIVEIWTSQQHIKHSLLSRHRYFTTLFVVTVSYLPAGSSEISSLALSSSFISGVGMYVGLLDQSVRRCGMLVAEIVAQLAGKQLDFGDWEGDDSGKPWARELRKLIISRDADAVLEDDEEVVLLETTIIKEPVTDELNAAKGLSVSPQRPSAIDYDSDDSLTGYASPPSSRSASPTPSELDEIEKDPSLNIGAKKIHRPVYLAQLGEMVRSTGGLKNGDANEVADQIEMALTCGEELIRRKRDYGTELEENSINLAYGFIGLQNNYDLEGFDMKRQAAVTALVACCPRNAAPALIEEFFKNQYSTDQRYVILNALALGSRELAGLPLPSGNSNITNHDRTSFPSKSLPPQLHQKYITANQQGSNPIREILDGISHTAIERGADLTSKKLPALVRERQLRIRKAPKVAEVSNIATIGVLPRNKTTFVQVAAEFFIAPLINRFWVFLRDEQMREERTAHYNRINQYRGAGTGLILNAIVLSHFLGTLAVLVHAAQNSPEWLAVVAPDALELALTLGTRPVSKMKDDEDVEGLPSTQSPQGTEAAVLTGALELALVVLDGCMELDAGRALGLEHTALLLGTGEWAGAVFSELEKGALAPGGGGAQEIRLRRAAAAVLLKVDELTSKWRRSMVDVR